MKNRAVIILTSFLFILGSCEIAQRDPLEPALPEYTQTGKNSVGALINGIIWRDLNYVNWFNLSEPTLYVQFDTVKNKTRFHFYADLVLDSEETIGASVHVTFNDRVIKSNEDLLLLNATDWPIDGSALYAGVQSTYFEEMDCPENRSYAGKLFVRKSRNYISETEIQHHIFSGTFGFSINSDCGELNVFRGRFDYSKIRFSPINLD